MLINFLPPSNTLTAALLCPVVGPDAGGAGPRGVCEADPETAVLRLAHLQPRGRQNIPSHGAG